MILKELLSCDEVLRDIPPIAATEDIHQTTFIYSQQELADREETRHIRYRRSGKADFQHLKRYSLHPQILRVSRQLLQEGLPLLYKDKTVGFAHLYGYGVDLSMYCLGQPSVVDALTRWPALRSFRRWEYTIFMAPAIDNEFDPEYSISGPVDDMKALRHVGMDHFTTIFKLATNDTAPYDGDFWCGSALLAFTLSGCDNVQIEGELPRSAQNLMARYDLEKLKLPMEDYITSIVRLSLRIVATLQLCRRCFTRTEFRGLLECINLEHHSDNNLLPIHAVYGDCRDYLYLCYHAITECLRPCTGCGAANRGCDSALLKPIYRDIRGLEAQGPWKQGCEEIHSTELSILRQLT